MTASLLDPLLDAIGAKADEFLTADEIVALFAAIPQALPAAGALYIQHDDEEHFSACAAGIINYALASPPPQYLATSLFWGDLADCYEDNFDPRLSAWFSGVQQGFDGVPQASVISRIARGWHSGPADAVLLGYETGATARTLLGVG